MRNTSHAAVAERLRLLRIISGGNQAAFAARLGLETKRYSNIERGFPLSREVAFKIVQMFPDITLDWLYLGKTEGLSLKRARELQEIAEAEHEKTGRPGKKAAGR